MKILVVGAEVIGSVSGAHLAAAGNRVCVLRHGSRTDEVAVSGLCARNAYGGRRTDADAAVGSRTPAGSTTSSLWPCGVNSSCPPALTSRCWPGQQAIVVFGDDSRRPIGYPGNVPGDVCLASPASPASSPARSPATSTSGSGGQPCREGADPRLAALSRRCRAAVSLSGAWPTWTIGLPTMPRSWPASRRPCSATEPTPARLAADRQTLTLMCRPSPRHSPPARTRGRGPARATSPSSTHRR